MRACMVEIDDNKLRWVSARSFNINTMPMHKDLYTATPNDNTNVSTDGYNKLIQLTKDTYRDNYGYYFLTEEHPLFNAVMLTRNCIGLKLDDNFMISHLLEGVRYLVKKSILSASASFNK